MFLLLLVFTISIGSLYGLDNTSVKSGDLCLTDRVIPDLDLHKMLGEWHLLGSTKAIIIPQLGSLLLPCEKITFIQHEDGQYGIQEVIDDSDEQTTNKYAITEENGVTLVSADNVNEKIIFNIIMANYERIALINECTEYSNGTYLIARTAYKSKINTLESIREIFESHNIFASQYSTVHLENC